MRSVCSGGCFLCLCLLLRVWGGYGALCAPLNFVTRPAPTPGVVFGREQDTPKMKDVSGQTETWNCTCRLWPQEDGVYSSRTRAEDDTWVSELAKLHHFGSKAIPAVATSIQSRVLPPFTRAFLNSIIVTHREHWSELKL